MLTEEQRKAIEWASEHAANYARSIEGETTMMRHSRVLREILAAHNAGAQKPVAWLTPGNDLYLENPGYDDWTPLYTHPQPITDAARGVKRWREKIIQAMRAPSRGDFTIAINAIVREMTTEIERLDREKGE